MQETCRSVAAIALCASLLASTGCEGQANDEKRAIAGIENDLVADDAAVRAKAAAELTDRFPDGAVAVPMLVDLLDDEAPEVVTAAAKAIDAMVVPATDQLATYCTAPGRFDGDEGFGRRLQGTLSLRIVAPTDAFTRDGDDGPTTEGCAIAATTRFPRGPDSRWRTAAVRAFRASSGETRDMAAVALVEFGADSLVARQVRPEDVAGRAEAAKRLAKLVASSDPLESFCGSRMAERLRSDDASVIAALSAAVIAEKESMDALSGALGSFSARAATDALSAIGPAAAAAGPNLNAVIARSLREPFVDEAAKLFDGAVHALFRIGGDTAIAAVIEGGGPDEVRVAASAARAGCGSEIVLGRLVAMADKRRSGRAFDGLAALGERAAVALPLARAHLAEASDDAARCDRAAVVLAIAPDDPAALDVLDKMLDGKDISGTHTAPDEVNSAWYSLCRRAAPTEMVRRRAAAAIRSGHLIFAWVPAVEALGRCGPAAADAVPDLLELLNAGLGEPTSWPAIGRPVLVRTLGRIGPGAAAAIPALTALRDKGDETIRVPAAQALRRIKAKE